MSTNDVIRILSSSGHTMMCWRSGRKGGGRGEVGREKGRQGGGRDGGKEAREG